MTPPNLFFQFWLILSIQSTRLVIPFFAVVRKVKSGDFHFFTRPQSNNCLDNKGDDRCAHNRQHQGQANGLELFQHQRLEKESVT